MTDVELLLLHGNPRNNFTVCKQMRKSKEDDLYWIEMLKILTKGKWAQVCLKCYYKKLCKLELFDYIE